MAQPWHGSDTYVLDDGKGLPHTIMASGRQSHTTSGSRTVVSYTASEGEPMASPMVSRVLVIQSPIPECPSPHPLGLTKEDEQKLQWLLPSEREEVKRVYEEHKEVQRVDEEREEVEREYEEVQRVHAAKTEQMQLQLEGERCKVDELIQIQLSLEIRIRTTEEYMRASDAGKDREILALRNEVRSPNSARLSQPAAHAVRARCIRASCFGVPLRSSAVLPLQRLGGAADAHLKRRARAGTCMARPTRSAVRGLGRLPVQPAGVHARVFPPPRF
jgi:hypothetical protein